MALIHRGYNYVTIWLQTFVTFLILWVRKIRPIGALQESLSTDIRTTVTPEERFTELLDNEEYEEALKLAKKHKLDTDVVYKRRWLKLPRITIDSIRPLLLPIDDHDWVLAQCLICLPNCVKTNRELLNFGLVLVEELLNSISIGEDDDIDDESAKRDNEKKDAIHHNDPKKSSKGRESSPSSETSSLSGGLEWQNLNKVNFSMLEEEEKTWFAYRYTFLKYLRRLKSYETILQSNSRDAETISQEFWKRFRDQSCFESSLEFARKGEWRSVKVMLLHHSEDTKEHWLTLLSNFPETLKPALYQDLLPCGDTKGDQVHQWFQPHLKQKEESSENLDDKKWCSQLKAILPLEELSNKYVEDFYSVNAFYSDFRRAILDKNVASTWFLVRARQIESRSSLVSNAIELLELGIDRNIPGLESFKDDLDTYATLVYQCFPLYNMDDIGFSEFERLSKEERVNLLMLGASEDEDRFIECLQRFLLPYLRKIAKNKKEEEELLWDYIINSAKHKLNIVQKIFTSYRMEKEFGQISGKDIIQNDEALIEYGSKCIYACERTDQLDAAFNIVECFPEPENPIFQEDKKLNEMVISLYRRLEVAELLEQYNYYVTVQRLEEIVQSKDVSAIETILKKITREFCRGVDALHLKEGDWAQFCNDLERIRAACFSDFLPLYNIYEIFIKGILTSGRLEHFQFAAHFMQLTPSQESITQSKKKLVKYEKSVEIILDAARHYVNSANSVSDEVINTAKKCLALLGGETTSCPEIEKEKNFIEALSILSNEFDFSILPIQIRLMEDSKIELIHQIISSQPKAYKKTNELMRLAKNLNIFIEDGNEDQEVMILSILGNYAYERGDFNHCWSLCKTFLDKEYSKGWRLCELLGNSASFKDNYAKLKLLSFALIHCDNTELIFEILTNIRKLKLILLQDSMACLQEQQENGISSPLSSLSSTSSALLSSLPTIEITSKLIKSLKRRPEDEDEKVLATRKKDPSSCYNFINISPFYCDAFQRNSHFTFNANNCDYNYLGFGEFYSNQINLELSNQQLKLRTEMLKDNIDWKLVLSICQESSFHYLPVDTVLSLSCLLPLKQYDEELPFKRINPKPPALIFAGLYFHSLVLNLKTIEFEKDDSPSISQEPMSQIITKADAKCKKCNNSNSTSTHHVEKRLIEKYFEMYCNIIQSETIASLDPNVDVERFACEEEYRKDTLLGLTMTTDDKIFNVVISLGRQYDVPLIDLYLAHLEYLLTDLENEVETIASKVYKNEDFIKILSENPKYLEDHFEKRIFPLIAVDDHNRLVLCYQIIEKICYPPTSSSPGNEDDEASST